MKSSQTSFLSEIESGEPIPLHKRAYFRERIRNNLYDLIVSEFQRQEASRGLTKAALTRRIDSRPEQVSRWLGSPGNWTLDTVSDLLLGLGVELDSSILPLAHRGQRNSSGPEWLRNDSGPSVSDKVATQPSFGESSTTSGSSVNNIAVITSSPPRPEAA